MRLLISVLVVGVQAQKRVEDARRKRAAELEAEKQHAEQKLESLRQRSVQQVRGYLHSVLCCLHWLCAVTLLTMNCSICFSFSAFLFHSFHMSVFYRLISSRGHRRRIKSSDVQRSTR